MGGRTENNFWRSIADASCSKLFLATMSKFGFNMIVHEYKVRYTKQHCTKYCTWYCFVLSQRCFKKFTLTTDLLKLFSVCLKFLVKKFVEKNWKKKTSLNSLRACDARSFLRSFFSDFFSVILEIITSAVWEANAPQHNGGPIKSPPSTSRNRSSVMFELFQWSLNCIPIMPRDTRFSRTVVRLIVVVFPPGSARGGLLLTIALLCLQTQGSKQVLCVYAFILQEIQIFYVYAFRLFSYFWFKTISEIFFFRISLVISTVLSSR